METFRIKPRRLHQGATLGIIAPASPGSQETALAGIEWLKSQGYQIKLGQSVQQEWGYLAGRDELRAQDLTTMFSSPEVDGILCLRGGYGTMRILTLLDYDLIKKHPKLFIGYSDITALHTAIGQLTGLVTFHGPMAASDMSKEMPAYTWEYLLQAITSPQPIGLVNNPPSAPSPEFITAGTAEGILTGGNLSMICATLGTPYEIDTRGKILCLEDIGEAPYRIDRMLTQLLLAGKLHDAAGIVCDVFADCEDSEPDNFTVKEVLQNRLGSLPIPVLIHLYFGHTADKITLPLGVNAVLRQKEGLIITETATND